VRVFDEPLRTRVPTDDALPAGSQRDLAPRAAGRRGQLQVDEGRGAVDGAPLADGLRLGGADVGQRLDDVEAAEARPLAGSTPVAGTEGGADRPRLAGVRVEHDVGVRHLAG